MILLKKERIVLIGYYYFVIISISSGFAAYVFDDVLIFLYSLPIAILLLKIFIIRERYCILIRPLFFTKIYKSEVKVKMKYSAFSRESGPMIIFLKTNSLMRAEFSISKMKFKKVYCWLKKRDYKTTLEAEESWLQSVLGSDNYKKN
jgi:hypothetical protein